MPASPGLIAHARNGFTAAADHGCFVGQNTNVLLLPELGDRFFEALPLTHADILPAAK